MEDELAKVRIAKIEEIKRRKGNALSDVLGVNDWQNQVTAVTAAFFDLTMLTLKLMDRLDESGIKCRDLINPRCGTKRDLLKMPYYLTILDKTKYDKMCIYQMTNIDEIRNYPVEPFDFTQAKQESIALDKSISINKKGS